MATPTFDPANFARGQDINNPFMPLDSGTKFVFDTFAADGSLEQIDTQTVLERTKMIDGVRCTVVLDVVKDPATGELIERTKDYFAQDKSGNVWYFGEDSVQYENGKPVSTEGSWHAGVAGALPGIIMEAHPKIGDSYDQENAPDVAHDHAVVTGVNGTAHVPAGDFNHLLVTLETSVLEPGAKETKAYAAGVGQVYGKDLVSGEVDKLVSVTGDDDAKLAHSMATFGTGGPALDAGTLAGPMADAGLQSMLASHSHHA